MSLFFFDNVIQDVTKNIIDNWLIMVQNKYSFSFIHVNDNTVK